MSQYKRTPAHGLEILECLYKDNPHNQLVVNSLINAYIQMKSIDMALKVIETILKERKNILSLNLIAWYHAIKNNVSLEFNYQKLIFNRELQNINLSDREYIINQSKIIDKKDSYILKQRWELLFNLAFSSLPIGLRSLLGQEIKSIVLIANNPDIPLYTLQDCIEENSLVVYFNYNTFLEAQNKLANKYNLWFFRKDLHNLYDNSFHGFTSYSSKMHDSNGEIDNTKLFYDLVLSDTTFLLFNESLPAQKILEPELFKKICNPSFSSYISAINILMHNYPAPDKHVNRLLTEPSSGYLVFIYLYYSKLYLDYLNKNSFDITLIGFNFNKNSIYRRFPSHNWEYEREQFENLPLGINRIVI